MPLKKCSRSIYILNKVKCLLQVGEETKLGYKTMLAWIQFYKTGKKRSEKCEHTTYM